MPYLLQPSNSTANSSSSLDTSPDSIPVSSLFTEGSSLQANEPAPYQRPRVDTLDPLNDADKQVAVSLTALPNITRPEPTTDEQSRPSWIQRTCLHWLTAYRILICLTFVVNLAVLIAWLQTELPLAGVLQATSANILVAIVGRQEDLISASFFFVTKTPVSLPLWARKFIADFHHYGGLHIGSAFSALMWYCLFIAINTLNTVAKVNRGEMNPWLWADITTCYAFLAFILFICITAHPRLRVKFHNTFEHTHRFVGWAALLVLWVNAGICTKAHATTISLYQSPSIWLLAVSTFFIILPWLRIRRVPVQAEAISSRAVKLTFRYANMPHISTMRFSTSPLMEWHAFATIPSADGAAAHIIISQAGDWTKSIIQNPPREIWIRHPPTANFLAGTALFNSVLLVATGAGIGPMISLLQSPAVVKMKAEGKQVRVMWCAYDPDALHWAFVRESIKEIDAMPKIFDSRRGRPDLAFEARYMKHLCGIEAVFVVSNKVVTNSVVREIKAQGGAAYGAVFDS